MDRPFVKGLELSRLFYQEAVRPILERRLPEIPYSAARMDGGSDVLGFDTPQSMDHDWGPRLQLFVRPEDWARYGQEIEDLLRHELPLDVHGYPTHFIRFDDGSHGMQEVEQGPVRHRVGVQTVASFFVGYLGFDPREPMSAIDWLTAPEQCLRTVTSGCVYHDGLGELEPVRSKLRTWPRDVWLYLLAAQWRRIAQEEPFMGRCGDVGDEVGSQIVAARLVRDVMKLCFTMERQYAPYIKWFGTAFARLACAKELMPLLSGALGGKSWQERESFLSSAYGVAVRMHNDLGITDPLPTEVSPFYGRPYLVIHADDVVDAIRARITDPVVLALPAHIGSVDQVVDSTDVLSDARRCQRLRAFYLSEEGT